MPKHKPIKEDERNSSSPKPKIKAKILDKVNLKIQDWKAIMAQGSTILGKTWLVFYFQQIDPM